MPGAAELLSRVRRTGRQIAIVTNNTVVEQRLKLDRCRLTPLVDLLVTSEEVGISKPDPEIFHAALRRLNRAPADAVMLGDNWAADVEGARAAGIRAVWLNRSGEACPDPSVAQLRSLEPVHEAFRSVVGQW